MEDRFVEKDMASVAWLDFKQQIGNATDIDRVKASRIFNSVIRLPAVPCLIGTCRKYCVVANLALSVGTKR